MAYNKCKKSQRGCDCNKIIYDPCIEEQGCLEKIDADCVIYNRNNINGFSNLINLNVPNGTSLKAILEIIDNKINNTTQLVSTFKTLDASNDINIEKFDEIGKELNKLKNILDELKFNTIAIEYEKYQSQINYLKAELEKVSNSLFSLKEIKVNISIKSDNQIKNLDDGLYVAPLNELAETPIGTKDKGRSIKLYASGKNNHNLEADLKIEENTLNPIIKNLEGDININVETIIDIILAASPNSALRMKFKQLLLQF